MVLVLHGVLSFILSFLFTSNFSGVAFRRNPSMRRDLRFFRSCDSFQGSHNFHCNFSDFSRAWQREPRVWKSDTVIEIEPGCLCCEMDGESLMRAFVLSILKKELKKIDISFYFIISLNLSAFDKITHLEMMNSIESFFWFGWKINVAVVILCKEACFFVNCFVIPITSDCVLMWWCCSFLLYIGVSVPCHLRHLLTLDIVESLDNRHIRIIRFHKD
jgi:hypothetical protein